MGIPARPDRETVPTPQDLSKNIRDRQVMQDRTADVIER